MLTWSVRHVLSKKYHFVGHGTSFCAGSYRWICCITPHEVTYCIHGEIILTHRRHALMSQRILCLATHFFCNWDLFFFFLILFCIVSLGEKPLRATEDLHRDCRWVMWKSADINDELYSVNDMVLRPRTDIGHLYFLKVSRCDWLLWWHSHSYHRSFTKCSRRRE